MPRTAAQFGEIREGKISLIMQTALELFANEGYYPTSISRIAENAGISKGLMYNYFKSKEELIIAIIGKGIEKLTQSLDPDRNGLLTEEEFEYLITESFRALRENPEYWKLFFSIMMQPAVSKIVSKVYQDLLPHRLPVIIDYFRRKGIPDPVVEAYLFDAMVDGIFLNYIMNPEGFALEEMKREIV